MLTFEQWNDDLALSIGLILDIRIQFRNNNNDDDDDNDDKHIFFIDFSYSWPHGFWAYCKKNKRKTINWNIQSIRFQRVAMKISSWSIDWHRKRGNAALLLQWNFITFLFLFIKLKF